MSPCPPPLSAPQEPPTSKPRTSTGLPASGGPWLTLLCVTLLGYALLGRGWAYVGVPPLFIGEVMLLCGLLSWAWLGNWRYLPDLLPSWLLLLLLVWGVCRTLPDLPRHGIEALRDSVIWSYSLCALVVCGSLLAQPSRLAILLRRFRQLSRILPVCLPLAWIPTHFFANSLPRWPWADVPMLEVKGGDVMVHLSGILAFSVAGFGSLSAFRLIMFAVCVSLVGALDRSGLLSFLMVSALCFLHNPRHRSLWSLIGLGACTLAFLAVTDLRVKMPEREREVSFTQLATNVASIGGSTRAGDLDDTKEWRLEWWRDIFRYTLGGKYFWTGKGFGISLGEDDGFAAEHLPMLRSPHNGHLTMLARGGVPGLLLWVCVQLAWAGSILAAYLRSRRLAERHWAGLFLFLLGYWLAFMINASFDVFLEGPMGGLWLWTVYGVGLAALWLYKYCPDALPEDMRS